MSVKLTVDLALDCPLGEFLVTLRGARLVSYIAIGPAGGNPSVTLEFATLDAARAYYTELDIGTPFEAHLGDAAQQAAEYFANLPI